MVSYEYKCPSCNERLVIQRSIHEEERIPCCNNCAIDMKKVFGAPSVNLVGRGFYRNGG